MTDLSAPITVLLALHVPASESATCKDTITQWIATFPQARIDVYGNLIHADASVLWIHVHLCTLREAADGCDPATFTGLQFINATMNRFEHYQPTLADPNSITALLPTLGKVHTHTATTTTSTTVSFDPPIIIDTDFDIDFDIDADPTGGRVTL